MDSDSQNILAEAAGRNVGLVLSLPSAGMLRHHKSRFLAQCDEGLWIESAPQDNALIDDLIARSQSAAVSFKSGTGKASFAAIPLKRNSEYKVNEQTIVEALLLSAPNQIKVVQRRNDYRVRVTPDSELVARIWRITENADLAERPVDRLQLNVQLRDLSISGLGINLLPKEDLAHNLVADERLRIELEHAGQSVVVEGRVRHVPTIMPAGAVRIGVQFKKLEGDLDGRQTIALLTRIVAQLQRDEVRRMRLGLVTN